MSTFKHNTLKNLQSAVALALAAYKESPSMENSVKLEVATSRVSRYAASL